jgi:hypothetical protein
MIVSASRRTDIPAFYPDWLMGRIEAGYCLVRNPFDARRLRRVSLDPAEVDFLVLWTRDPRPLAPRLGEIEERGLRFYVQMTIAGYPRSIEPGAPPLEEALRAFRELADRVGPERALWRYDPVILARSLDASFHLEAFGRIAAALEGSTKRVTLSVVDEYAATRSRLAAAGFPEARFEVEAYAELLGELAAIARSRGMRAQACAEKAELRERGIEAGACVDAALAASLWPGPPLAVSHNASAAGELDFGDGPSGLAARDPGAFAARDPGQRPACLCAKSVDIGAYGTCPRGCAYCYANRGRGSLLGRGPADEAL